jgi:hypothetical protein
MGCGVVVLLLLVWVLGQKTPMRRYESHRWTWREMLVVVAAVLPLLLLLVPWPSINQSSLYYSPYPKVSLPPFNMLVGLALVLLALPGVMPRD